MQEVSEDPRADRMSRRPSRRAAQECSISPQWRPRHSTAPEGLGFALAARSHRGDTVMRDEAPTLPAASYATACRT
jgi:hypothetical protein